MDRRANATACRDYAEEHGALPPGVKINSIRTVGVYPLMNNIIHFKGQKSPKRSRISIPTAVWPTVIAAGFPSIRYQRQGLVLRHQGQNYPFMREDDGTPLTYIDVIIVGVSRHYQQGLSPARRVERGLSPAGRSAPRSRATCRIPACRSRSPRPAASARHNEWITKPSGRPRQGMPGPQADGGAADAGDDHQDAGFAADWSRCTSRCRRARWRR